MSIFRCLKNNEWRIDSPIFIFAPSTPSRNRDVLGADAATVTISLPRRSVRHRTDGRFVEASDESIDDDEAPDDPDMPALVDRDSEYDDAKMAILLGDDDDDDVAISPVAAKAAPQSECLSRPLFRFICDFDRPP